MEQFERWIKQEIINSSDVFRSIAESCSKDISKTSEIIISAIKKGNKIFWCGNGGSAAQASTIFFELPLVEIAIKTSPVLPRASICREKIVLKSVSFDQAVINDVSVVSDMEGRAIRSWERSPHTSSVDKC